MGGRRRTCGGVGGWQDGGRADRTPAHSSQHSGATTHSGRSTGAGATIVSLNVTATGI